MSAGLTSRGAVDLEQIYLLRLLVLYIMRGVWKILIAIILLFQQHYAQICSLSYPGARTRRRGKLAMSDHMGQRIGNYHLLRLLGKGGYAEVYLGQHRYLKTEAAIKIFPVFSTEEDRTAFLSEAQVMARLIHAHIVRILEGSIEQGIPFLVMDYAPNGTLKDRHTPGEQLTPETVLAYVKDVAGALHYAHQEHLIHRDIKPGNLLLGRHMEVLLSDFGLAMGAYRSHTQPRSEGAGTVAYIDRKS